eukprot:CAMPEP_0172439646 /NCGR_PEP_ID=MMETSP1065-20121228/561_1 /TAXON_ID=265537 /ORGANISM="Amphiprora paludosa, Strain CCMP125" /LENGTH=897 /DNA_ID=CAMNT_0013188355 /DNA_START=80 /DNA_END=2776 /DNA_ORIENTATION=-
MAISNNTVGGSHSTVLVDHAASSATATTTTTTSTTSSMIEDELRQEIQSLQEQLQASRAQTEDAQQLIAALREQLRDQDELQFRSNNLQEQLNTYMRSRMTRQHTRSSRSSHSGAHNHKQRQNSTNTFASSIGGGGGLGASSVASPLVPVEIVECGSDCNSVPDQEPENPAQGDPEIITPLPEQEAEPQHHRPATAEVEPRPSPLVLVDPEEQSIYSRGSSHSSGSSSSAPSSYHTNGVRDIVDEIQRWLFLEGGNLRDVESLITEYCNFLNSIGIPLDRIFIAGMMLHPNISAYVWKWETGQDFNEHEVPHSAFQKPNYNPDEPFAVLLEGRAMEYRMNAKTKVVPPGCAWFAAGGYKDYYALPIYHRGEFKGAMAWCTKCTDGWNDQHVQVFEQSLAALSTVLRLHTNDLVTKTLTGRLEEEVQKQTQELATANANLERANQKIVQQSQAQLRHFAMMSHEIRTPLNCIVSLSNLLLESEQVQQQAMIAESVEMITSSGDLLVAVVDDVLDYSKLAAGKVEATLQVAPLRPTLQTVLAAIRAKAPPRLEIQTPWYDLPRTLRTDTRRLQQILYNLLGNAIKFGRHGKVVEFGVRVVEKSAKASPADDNQPTEVTTKVVQFIVKDYGKGIAPSDMGKIFEPFLQASTNAPADGGTGLGLSITRQLVRVLGGTISVKSEFGKWCEFQVELPLEEGDEEDQETTGRINYSENDVPVNSSADTANKPDERTENRGREASSAPSELSPASIRPQTSKKPRMAKTPVLKPGEQAPEWIAKLRILIAEDNLVNQKVLLRTLNRIGLKHVDIVDNGQLAVQASERESYDLIFMDVQMPVMDGLEATRIIAERPQHPKIVFLTAHALQDYQDKASAAGGDGFISKPFKPDIIREMLGTLFGDQS